jgi:hypothetical protein
MVPTQYPFQPRDKNLVEQIQSLQQQVCDNLPQVKKHNFSNKACNSQSFRFKKFFLLFPGHSRQWRPLILKGGGLIQVDIGGHPPVPIGSSCHILVQHVLLYFFVIMGSTLPGMSKDLHIFHMDTSGVPPVSTL